LDLVDLLTPSVSVTEVSRPYNGRPAAPIAVATGLGNTPVSGGFALTYYVGPTVNGSGSPTAPTDAGVYTVVASFNSDDLHYTNAKSPPATFSITSVTPSFSGLGSPTNIVGSTTTTLSGKISLGSLIPTGNVTITLNAISKSVAINACQATIILPHQRQL
jgi:hypothetical protein